jgi:hypothetical protein
MHKLGPLSITRSGEALGAQNYQVTTCNVSKHCKTISVKMPKTYAQEGFGPNLIFIPAALKDTKKLYKRLLFDKQIA